ncbi:MAG TPA: 2OG-Fe(II) oxygenase family protein [Allosphingosinicella sp.]|nr:2OG-Fe(II) oxygenase family protein [Allosphingosinicella sp.]
MMAQHKAALRCGLQGRAEELEQPGYMVIDLADDVRRDIVRLSSIARRYFDLPEPEQGANALPFGCGHWTYGFEHSGIPDSPDRVSFFGASIRTATLADRLPTPLARELHRRLLGVFSTFEVMAEDLMVGLASRCGLADAAALRGGLRRWSMIQISRTLPTPAGDPIYHEHEDGHLLSFAQANGLGLEISTAGAYRRAPYSPASILVMPGELMRLLTGGRVAPLYHRVRAVPRKRPRLALLFFADLDPDLCAPWVDGLADKAGCAAHVLSNAARFGMPCFTQEDPDPGGDLSDQLPTGNPPGYDINGIRTDNSGLCAFLLRIEGRSSSRLRSLFAIVPIRPLRSWVRLPSRSYW